MIKRFGDYDQTQAYGDFERLPKGGYICKILDVQTCAGQSGRNYLKIALDIAEGDYSGFYHRAWKEAKRQNEDAKWQCNFLLNIPTDDGSEQDGWTKRSFKTFTNALEDSNAGYHFDWDESKFKGKLVGGLFNEREYEGRDGTVRRSTNFARPVPVDKIRSGDYKLPDDKLLNKAPRAVGSSFVNVPEGIEDELPFN